MGELRCLKGEGIMCFMRKSIGSRVQEKGVKLFSIFSLVISEIKMCFEHLLFSSHFYKSFAFSFIKFHIIWFDISFPGGILPLPSISGSI